MNPAPLSYIDANVFLAYIAGPEADPKQYPLARTFFKSLPGGKQIGVFSYLTALEILDVLRKWNGWEFEKLSNLTNDEDRIKLVIDNAQNTYAQVITEMLAIPEIRFMETLQIDITQLLRDALEILSDLKGTNNPLKLVRDSTYLDVGFIILLDKEKFDKVAWPQVPLDYYFLWNCDEKGSRMVLTFPYNGSRVSDKLYFAHMCTKIAFWSP